MANINQAIIMATTFKIEGIEGVIREIKKLPDDRVKRQKVSAILTKQMAPVLRAVKANTPIIDPVRNVTIRGVTYEPGNLERSMGIFKGKSKTFPSVFVGPARGRKKGKADGFYGWFIVYGTSQIKPDDFIEKAASPLLETTGKKMSKETEKYILRQIKTLNL